LATGLIEQYAPEQRMLAPRIRERLGKELDAIPTKALAEYFSKQSVSQELFSVAKQLEAAAYKTAFVSPQALPATAKWIMGVLLDFWEIDRQKFLHSADTTKAPTTSSSIEPRKTPRPSAQSPLPGLEVEKNG
jgi:hypothetical protein